MKHQRTIFAVDSHTEGEPLRLVVGGFPTLRGQTMLEKKNDFIQRYDHLRRALMLEPRGHHDMFGAVLTQPTMPEADVGVLFMHGGGMNNMCGHGTIAVNTILVETGMVDVHEPVTNIKMEVPAGLIDVRVQVQDGRAKQVSFENVPSFLYQSDAEIDVPGYGKLTVDIAFGGNFFAIVQANDLGLDISPENSTKLAEAGMAILRAANAQINVQHPEMPFINTIGLCKICGPAKSPDADMQNIVIFDGQIDRSPCGTGTSAMVATLWAKGKLALNEALVNESVINTKFIGKALRETTVGSYRAIIPEVTGSAYITGFSEFLIDDEDPVKYGFDLK